MTASAFTSRRVAEPRREPSTLRRTITAEDQGDAARRALGWLDTPDPSAIADTLAVHRFGPTLGALRRAVALLSATADGLTDRLERPDLDLTPDERARLELRRDAAEQDAYQVLATIREAVAAADVLTAAATTTPSRSRNDATCQLCRVALPAVELVHDAASQLWCCPACAAPLTEG